MAATRASPSTAIYCLERQKVQQRRLSGVWSLYILYGTGLSTIVVAALIFWTVSFHAPILFSYEFGLWLQANDKYTAIFCTIFDTLLGTRAFYLFN